MNQKRAKQLRKQAMKEVPVPARWDQEHLCTRMFRDKKTGAVVGLIECFRIVCTGWRRRYKQLKREDKIKRRGY